VISHIFIDRPILASVVSIVIVVMGLLAMQFLPIAQFPEITRQSYKSTRIIQAPARKSRQRLWPARLR